MCVRRRLLQYGLCGVVPSRVPRPPGPPHRVRGACVGHGKACVRALASETAVRDGRAVCACAHIHTDDKGAWGKVCVLWRAECALAHHSKGTASAGWTRAESLRPSAHRIV